MFKNSRNSQTNTLSIIHITDNHLLNDINETFHGINTKNSLELILSKSQSRYPHADFILFTGDISQTGERESYAIFESLLQNANRPVYCVPGNHDRPELLQQVIPDCPNNTINVIKIGTFSLILLNSWVKDKNHGMISQNDLKQLEQYIEKNNNQFNIIALHHPPTLIKSKWLDDIGLHNQTAFLKIIDKHYQNTLLICGHVHQEVDLQLDTLRLLATPSTCHQFKANSDTRYHIDTPSPAYRYIKLTTNNIHTKVHYIE